MRRIVLVIILLLLGAIVYLTNFNEYIVVMVK